ncbi:OmpP1/FadL family transporter [Nonlabens antarcticus]|uniref:OmpP1/FadL family transporter n=1 Tax=Nonlabens antarcticus TaxID=392714 RepID=UPI001891B884|nr:outer membrane protein transport protein [Nonlabens antarcticus]
MKNIFITSALLIGAFFCEAQTVTDGLLYGQQDNLYGTARYRALSGAFGALGGDLSAVGKNPAGSVIFNNNYASFTLANSNRNNDSNYFGTLSGSDSSDFDINQAGGVLVFTTNAESPLTKFSLGFNYDATRSYDDNVYLTGTSNTSISQYFLNNARGFTLDNFETRDGESVADLYQFLGEDIGFDAQQGLLGFQGFIIDPVAPGDASNTQYVSSTGTGSFNQGYEVISSGTQGKFSFNIAGEFYERLSVGLNLNSHFIDYTRFTGFRELNSNADATTTDVQFNNRLETTGNGFSFQVGAIGKITEALRIGATYESPTWYDIEETLIQEVFTTQQTGNQETFKDVVPNVLNIYAPYDLKSPGSVTGSIAYIFGNKGLLSVDYSSRDYASLKFSPENNSTFASNNDQIANQLERAGTLRIGGEYRIDKFTLRAGYRMVESPYEDKSLMDDLNGYSAGLGYSWGSTTLDLSYDYSKREYSQQLFSTGLTNRSLINNENNNIVLTLGFNL